MSWALMSWVLASWVLTLCDCGLLPIPLPIAFLTFDIAARRVLNDRILRQFEIVQFGFGEPSYFAGTSRVDSVYCGFNAATPVGY
ncbi:MAG: hypothetical protein ABJZ55_12395 [Fuerstiella sp.]